MRTLGVLWLSCPLLAWAVPEVSCRLEQGGDVVVVNVPTAHDALGGHWQTLGKFKVRTWLTVADPQPSWLGIEVYARAADGDYRLVSAHRQGASQATGEVEVIEPRLGRSLRYRCGARQ